MNEFQERLQELLDEYSLSRLQLSKNIGISFETLNGYFNKDLYPEISCAARISKYFKCSINYLMGLTDEFNNQDINNLSFCDTIKKLVKEKNISIEKLMTSLNMGETNFYRWQRGNNKPAMNSIIAIAKYFDVSIDYLIYEYIK
ncbi:MAG: helix-turn-helix domain-containing protein [Clostridia bacterium]|nr:helix-turn-helix domain-containing protein [Clostridia bacterium]